MTSCLISSTMVELRVEGAIEARDEPRFFGVATALMPTPLPYTGVFSFTTSAGAAAAAAAFAAFLGLK